MNTIYRIVRSASTGRWVVASELAKGRKKNISVAAAFAVTVISLSFSGAVIAQTTGNAAPGDACTTENGTPGTINAENVCVAPTNSEGAIQPRAITPRLTLDDNFIKILNSDGGTNVAAKATGLGAIAIGPGSESGQATGTVDTMAIGLAAKATGTKSTALGRLAEASGTSSLAAGDTSAAKATNSVALGYMAVVNATASDSVALGSNSIATEANTISVGNSTLQRKIVNVADATLSSTSTDAVTGRQLYATNQEVAANKANIATNTSDIATNKTNITSLSNQINNGSVGLVKQDADSKAITVANATGGTTINFAGTAGNRRLGGIANGVGDNDAVTIAQLKAVGLVDPNGKPLAALVYDDLTLGSAKLGGTKGTVIRNLANGLIGRGSMEAINGGQLFDFQQDVQNQLNALNNQVNQITQGLNDGSLGGAGGAGTGTNSAALGEGANASGSGSTASGANSVASGNNSTANGSGAQATGNNSTALGSNATASANNSVALGGGSVADRDNTVSVGSVGAERQITNVAAGTERTDAANWGQVQDAVQGAKDWASRKFEQVDGRIDRMGAMSAAYSQMAFSAQGVNTPNRVGVGVGMQGGKSAVAVGVSHQFSPNFNVSFGGSASGKEASVGAGMAFGW